MRKLLLIFVACVTWAQVTTVPDTGGGSGSGTVAGTSGAAACFDSATSVGDCSAGSGITIAAGVISGDPTVNLMFTSDTADASGSCTLGSVWIRTDNGKMWACNTPPTWVRFAELDANGRIVAAMMPALTGDVTTSAGAVATTVVKIQGRAMASTAPSDGQAIVWDNANTTWKPGTAGGSSTTYWASFNTAMRSGATNSMCCGWSTGNTNGGSIAHVNGDANYISTAATHADAADTHHIWRGVVPPNYTGQTVTAKFYWMATLGTTNAIRVSVATAFVAPGGSYVPSFNTAQETTSTSGGNNVVNTITFTLTMTGADAGDEWYIRFTRLGTDGADTLAATSNLLRMELSY